MVFGYLYVSDLVVGMGVGIPKLHRFPREKSWLWLGNCMYILEIVLGRVGYLAHVSPVCCDTMLQPCRGINMHDGVAGI